MSDISKDRLMSKSSVAQAMKVSLSTVDRYIQQANNKTKFPDPIYIGGMKRYSVNQLTEWADLNKLFFDHNYYP